MGPFTISISNKSGSKQSYAIFAEAPTIKPSSSERRVTTGIITSVHGVSNGKGQASFILSKQLYATCGTYDVEFDSTMGDENKSPIGTGTEVVDQREVELSYVQSNGTLVHGSLWEVDASGGSPSFATSNPEPGAEKECFAIKTRGDFTDQEAKLSMSCCLLWLLQIQSCLISLLPLEFPVTTFLAFPSVTRIFLENIPLSLGLFVFLLPTPLPCSFLGTKQQAQTNSSSASAPPYATPSDPTRPSSPRPTRPTRSSHPRCSTSPSVRSTRAIKSTPKFSRACRRRAMSTSVSSPRTTCSLCTMTMAI